MLVYLPDEDRYVEEKDIPKGAKTLNISGTQVRDDYLAKGKLLPEWFTRPETAEILREMYPPRNKQGFCIWFTGLSGSGKSATTQVLTSLMLERGRELSHPGWRCGPHTSLQGTWFQPAKTAIRTSCASVL